MALAIGNITQSNDERKMSIKKKLKIKKQKIDYLEIQYCFPLTIFAPTLLLLKCYRKFVSKIQPSCWVLQIAILENNHKIFCVSL